MYKLLTKNGQLFALGLGILVILIFLISTLVGLNGSGYEMGTDLNALDSEAKSAINFFTPGLGATMGLVVIGALLWAGFGIFKLVSAPKDSLKFLMGFGVIILIFIIFFSISESETTGKISRLLQERDISEGTSKFISGGISTSLILLVLSAIAMVVAEIYNLFK